VLVTGAASGIGLATSRLFLEEGAEVAMADFRGEVVERARTGLRRTERSLSLAVDVRDRAGVEAAVDRAWQALGGLDTLVGCAGIYPSHPLLEMAEADWDAVLDTNLKGPFLVTQAFARRLVHAKAAWGHVVHITSGAALRARPGAAHYCSSKAGLEMLIRALALELAPHGIRVNAVSPGYVDVNSEVNPLSDEYKRAIKETIPLGRAGRPDDIAEAVAYLCTEAAEWVTGSIFRVDGGSAAGTTSLPLSRG